MRIAHYSNRLSRSAGGLFYSVSGLARAQQALGAEVSIYGGGDRFFEEDRKQWGDLSIHMHQAETEAHGFKFATARAIVENKPDILHIHGIWSAASVYGRIAAANGIRTVVAPRGMLDPWILERSATKKTFHALLFERPLLKRSLIHALNESEREAIRAYVPECESSIFVSPNGIEQSDRQSTGARKGALFISRLHEKKQVLELISSWASCNKLIGIPLTIAGWGDASYTERVEVACEDAENVKFVGSTYGEAKTRLLSESRFFILPSLSEGLPMAVLEGLDMGCVPIITRECNLPELFSGNCAIEMKSDFSNFDEICQVVAGMSDNEWQVRSSTAQIRARDYSWPNIASNVLNQYDNWLSAIRHS